MAFAKQLEEGIVPGALQQDKGSAEAKPATAEGGVIVTPLMEFLRQKHSGRSSAFTRKALARGRRRDKGKMTAILEEVGALMSTSKHADGSDDSLGPVSNHHTCMNPAARDVVSCLSRKLALGAAAQGALPDCLHACLHGHRHVCTVPKRCCDTAAAMHSSP
jgi:hypothetical protein